MLTPLDLNGKTFSKSFRGYDADEVNQFFLQVSKEYERLYQDNVELKDSVERVSAKLEYYQRMESTMQSTLVVAQETAEEVKKNSLQKAEVLTKETELACSKQKEAIVSFCNKLRADTEAEITRMKSEAEAYSEEIRKQADAYAVKTRAEADDYGKSTRTDADSYAMGLRSKTDSSTSKLREEAQSFVDKMKSLAEIEVAKMKVNTEDSCKSQLAESREQARTLTAEASAHANQIMADANQQSQNIVAEATQKAHEMIADAQKQSRNIIVDATQKSHQMVAEATERSRSMIHEATERSRSMIHEATERSQKMVFIAETKAAAAMDTYNTMINKANSQSKQFKSLLQSQLALYENFDADFAVDQMVQTKLQAVKKAEPVLDTKAEDVAVKAEADVAAKAEADVAGVDTEVTESREEPVREVEPQEVASQEVAPQEVAKTENVAKTEQEPVKEAAEPDRVVEQSVEKNKEKSVEPENMNVADEVAESSPRPLFSRFKPRNSVDFNRNGFPRKNADLRVALSELQKSAETKYPSSDANSESAGEADKTESQTVGPKPEENKES
ncbi:MAG: DivIVA domain-containing protein [Acidaminococcaceae bacterium]|nr:DivIVA domain-containing protein [Acidaminococcaceae bacterium]